MAALGNRVLTTTQSRLLPKVVDTVLNSNVLAARVLGKASKFSGERMKFPVKVSKNQTGQAFSGFDSFSTSATDNRVNLEFVPKFYQMTVALPLDELSTNQVDKETQMIDLAKLELQSTAQDMADDIGTLFYGVGSAKEFLGLEAIVDDGTNAATFGTLSRTTYSSQLRSTVTASAGVLSLAKMSTLYNAVSSGSVKTTLGITTEAVFALYESLLQPQERISKDFGMISRPGTSLGKEGGGMIGGTGFTGLYYKGFPVLADEKCTSGVLYFLNEDFLDWYALPMAMTTPISYRSQDIQGNDYSDVTGLGFSWSDWIKPTNSASLVGHIYLGGELISANPRRHGKLTGITTV